METLDKKSDQLNQTADNQKQRADERSDKKREQAQQEAAPSLQKAGKAAAEAAFISGGFQLAVGIYSKCKEGKKINEFTVDDWKDIGIDTAKAAAEAVSVALRFTASPTLQAFRLALRPQAFRWHSRYLSWHIVRAPGQFPMKSSRKAARWLR